MVSREARPVKLCNAPATNLTVGSGLAFEPRPTAAEVAFCPYDRDLQLDNPRFSGAGRASAVDQYEDPRDEPARPLRVRDAPRAPDQDRGARDRTYRAHSRPVADELPGGSTVPRRCAWPDAVRPLSHGAARPDEPPTRQINPQCVAQRVNANRSRRTDRRRACSAGGNWNHRADAATATYRMHCRSAVAPERQ